MQIVEQLTRSLGRELYNSVQKTTPSMATTYWWKQKAIMWFADDENLRTQMLRFVDVFPVLRTTQEKREHMKEYLFQGVRRPPFLFQMGDVMCKLGLGAELVTAIAGLGVKIMGQHFVVGATPKEVLKAVKDLQKEGSGYTLDVLGEAVLSESEADKHMEKYISFIERLYTLGCSPINLSLKLSALYSQFDPLNIEGCEEAKNRLRKILRAANSRGASVTIDAEQLAYRAMVLRIFMDIFKEEEFKEFKNAGIAMHTYFLDSEARIEEVIQWARTRRTPIMMRLVKGAYWDWEVIAAKQKGLPIPVYQEKWQTDMSYERCTRLVLENSDVVHLAVASHNFRTIAQAMANFEFLGIAPGKLEFQVLMGMGDHLKKAILGMGYPVTVYVPSGELLPGMAFLVRRIIENTSQTGFLFLSMGERVPVEELIENPHAAAV